MVDALKEIWRVLVADGCMLDWRDRPANWPLEIVIGEQVHVAGSADVSSRIPKHAASDEALGRVVDEGWFVCERQCAFDCIWYWDTLDELKDHMEKSIPEAVWTEAQRLIAESGEETRVRLRRNMGISRYRKRTVGIKPQ